MSEKRKKLMLILYIMLFVLCVTGIMIVFSVYDLQISKFATKNNLKDGEYFSNNLLGRFGECFGAMPIFILISLVGGIFYFYFDRKIEKKWLKVCVKIVSFVVLVAGFTLGFYKSFDYMSCYFSLEKKEYLDDSLLVKGIELVLGLALAILTYSFFKHMSKEANEKLFIWACLVIMVVVGYLIVWIIKTPVGRVRFRTMNFYNDFSYYTPWYKKGNAELFIPSLPFVDDCSKSFPSGHTYSGTTIICLMALPTLFERFNTKLWKGLIYAFSITFSILVAICRVMVGAHFASDTFFSIVLCSLLYIFAYEIFICKSKHIKLLFNK